MRTNSIWRANSRVCGVGAQMPKPRITAFLCVDHAVGESPQAAATNLLCERVPGFGVLFDELEGLECFNQESISKSRRL
mgnify:CR=1 FL=1